MGLFNKLFGTNDKVDKSEKQNVQPDFDALVEKARTSGQPTDLNDLYENFLSLNEWVFLTPSRLEIENAKPFIGEVDEKPWVFIFTSGQKANEYGRQFDGFLRDDGSIFLIRMKIKNSIDMLYKLSDHGVFGIRVNEGANGWFCPIKDLPNILKHIDLNIT